MLATLAVAYFLTFADAATQPPVEAAPIPEPQARAAREPIAELAIQAGPMLWLPKYSAGVPAFVGGELGVYGGPALLSLYYFRVTDNDSCGEDSGASGNTGWWELDTCHGVLNQVGPQLRLRWPDGSLHPWAGIGAGWYWQKGSGTGTSQGEDIEGSPISHFTVHRYEEGVTLFPSLGGEADVGAGFTLGLELQLGARLLTYAKEGNQTEGVGWQFGPSAITAALSARLGFQIY